MICASKYLKNLNQDQRYRLVKIENRAAWSNRVRCVWALKVTRKLNAYIIIKTQIWQP
jgi:hypothetical protein